MEIKFDINSLNFDDFKNKFTNQRNHVSKTIGEYIDRLADIKEFVNCEIFFHSKRQELLESIHTYMDLVLILQRELSVRKNIILVGIINDASTNFNMKSKDEKIIAIDGDKNIARFQQFIDLFNNQIMFLNESKKTLEGIIFNMKYRFEVQKYMDVC